MIEIKSMSKFYGKKQVLHNLNLTIDDMSNNIYALVGANGAGKTTILKVLAGIYIDDKHSISSTQCNEADYNVWARDNIAYVAADNRVLYMKNSIWDNIMYFACLKGASPKKVKENFLKYSEYIEFSVPLSYKVEQLSYGNQKKVCLMSALCADMKVFLLDEPSIGLDIDTINEFCKLLLILSTDYQKTIIISSHDMDFVSKIANFYIFITNGTCVCEIEKEMNLDEIYRVYESLKK